MKNWWQMNGILWKQYYIRHKVWIWLLLVMGVLLRLLEGRFMQQEYAGMMIGVYAQDEQGRELLDLLQQEEGIFRFLSFNSEEELRRQVENGSLECGYVLPEGFYRELLSGKFRRQIGIYYSPASSAHRISYEVVFSRLYQEFSDRILEDYLKESGFDSEQLTALLALKEEYESNESTFSFRYETAGGETVGEENSLDALRGCIGILIFFMSLLGLGNCKELTGISSRIPGFKGNKIKNISLDIAVTGSIVMGGILILISGAGDHLLKEVLGLAVFWVALEVYVRLLTIILPTPRAVYGVIPVLVLGSMLFAPVFIRIETYIPAVSLLGRLFPVTWYLEFFY